MAKVMGVLLVLGAVCGRAENIADQPAGPRAAVPESELNTPVLAATTTTEPEPVGSSDPRPQERPPPEAKPTPTIPFPTRCGGSLPPCYVMERESHGSLTVYNYSGSGASGKWQFMPGTWNGYGGYANAADAPESVQDAKARELWANGAGCSHWSAC